jgi:glycosyltransferase involved in cell wall biosynthesis
MSPAVTVLMPVFDARDYLAESLESVLGQSFGDFELLVVDDGCTDGSSAILDAHARRDRRIRILRQPNRGVVASLRRGIAEARAPFIARMDADDVALPDRLALQHRAMTARPELAVLGSAIRVTDAARQPIKDHLFETDPAVVRDNLLVVERHWVVAHPAVMMRTEVVRAAGAYRSQFLHAEDYDLWLRLSERHDIGNLDELLLEHRVLDGSVTRRNHDQQKLAVVAAMHCALRRRQGHPDPADALGRPVDDAFLEQLAALNGEAVWLDRLRILLMTRRPDRQEDLAAISQLIDRLARSALPGAEEVIRRCLPLVAA